MTLALLQELLMAHRANDADGLAAGFELLVLFSIDQPRSFPNRILCMIFYTSKE